MSEPFIDWANRKLPAFVSRLLRAERELGIRPEQALAIARICHEANREYCLTLNDASQPMWPQAPGWQRESAIAGVLFHLENPDADASASHESWLGEKERDGWTYGPVKDPEKREHPCMVPFGELPVDQRRKDHLFRAIVHGYLEVSGS